MGAGMIEGMLEPHMVEKANSSQTAVGVTFMIYAVAYTLASPIAGYVSLNIFLIIYLISFKIFHELHF